VRTVVFVAVEVLLVDVEAAEVLARANVFNDGYLDDLRLDRGLDGLSAGQRERLRETLQGQLAAGLDGALPLLGLEAASR
jgi:hypothetical protein